MNEYWVKVPSSQHPGGFSTVKVWADNFVVGEYSLNFFVNRTLTQTFNHRGGWLDIERVKR